MPKSDKAKLARVGVAKLWWRDDELYLGSMIVGSAGKMGFRVLTTDEFLPTANITEAKTALLKKIIELCEITPLRDKKTRHIKHSPHAGEETEGS